ncbi:MAG: prolipoprotein diacylglyceryl transferase [Clostridiales bacterium]|nr:prolipoprotein diacylglyceryl transferase [Clostridiales bacterium]
MEPIKLGFLTLYPFGLLLIPFALGAAALTARGMKKTGLKKETAGWFILLAVPLCFIMARLGFCLFVIDQIIGSEDFGMIFRVREGGFLLWGALGGGLLAACLTGRITKQPFGRISDSAIVGACLLIAAGRIICGLIFKDQGIGFPLSDWFNTEWLDPEEAEYANRFSLFALEGYSFFERLPFAIQNYYDEWCWAVFMPEALWACVMAWITSRCQVKEGGRTVLFIILYSCGQILLEAMLRGEVLHLPWLGFVRANQVICAAALVTVICICLKKLDRSERGKAALRCFAQLIPAIGIVVAMEFAAFEKKISLIFYWPADVCHLLAGLACLWMGLAAGRLWRKAYALQDPKGSGKIIQ